MINSSYLSAFFLSFQASNCLSFDLGTGYGLYLNFFLLVPPGLVTVRYLSMGRYPENDRELTRNQTFAEVLRSANVIAHVTLIFLVACTCVDSLPSSSHLHSYAQWRPGPTMCFLLFQPMSSITHELLRMPSRNSTLSSQTPPPWMLSAHQEVVSTTLQFQKCSNILIALATMCVLFT